MTDESKFVWQPEDVTITPPSEDVIIIDRGHDEPIYTEEDVKKRKKKKEKNK